MYLSSIQCLNLESLLFKYALNDVDGNLKNGEVYLR